MCVDGSQAVVQLRGALKRGPKKGISSACDRLRPPATACDRGHPPLESSVNLSGAETLSIPPFAFMTNRCQASRRHLHGLLCSQPRQH